MLACSGTQMRISQVARPRATAMAPHLRGISSAWRLPILRANAGATFRARSAASDATTSPVSQPSDGNGSSSSSSSPATAATAPLDPNSTAPVTSPSEGAPTGVIAVTADSAAAAAPAAATAPKPPVNENFTGDMLKPSVVNTPLVRAAAVLGAVAAVAGSTVLLPNTFGAFLHVTSYAVLLGTQLWNTFFVGITMFKSLPRQTFGKVQSKLFPQYFALTAGSNLLALVTLALAGAAATAPGVRALAALGVSLAGLLVNWLVLEPICTGLMFQRYDIENLPEKTDADKERIATLYKQFGKWHGISSLVNLVSFCVAVGHGWFLASLLVVAA